MAAMVIRHNHYDQHTGRTLEIFLEDQRDWIKTSPSMERATEKLPRYVKLVPFYENHSTLFMMELLGVWKRYIDPDVESAVHFFDLSKQMTLTNNQIEQKQEAAAETINFNLTDYFFLSSLMYHI